MKTAFITGVTGQDGSYLAELLLSKGYEVHGLLRRNSDFTTSRIDSIFYNKNFKVHYGDMTDTSNLYKILVEINPDEIYNLAAQSHVGLSFKVPEYSSNVDGLGVLRLLNVILDLGLKSKIYQASTSEMFGGLPHTVPQNENTAFTPKSPYSVSKLYAHWMSVNYRESYDLFICNGILFNHESPRRGRTFVTKKITQGVARIARGEKFVLRLGNINSKRDWGYAKEYVESMWLMLQQEKPDDYVVGTGKMYSVRDFVQKSFQVIGVDIEWRGEGLNEIGVNSRTKETLVRIDPDFYRPLEVDELCADFSKAKARLAWNPKTDINDLIKLMVCYDIKHSSYGHKEEVYDVNQFIGELVK